MIKNIKEADLKNKKVILRVDFNVPIKDGVILNDKRIRASLETINYILSQNAKLIILSHLGRIKTEEDLKENNLDIVAKKLEELLNLPVKFIPSTRGKQVENAINEMKNGEIVMLQNTRYEDFDMLTKQEVKLESKNNAELGKYWASLCDVFVNDAFAVSHRECASICGIAQNKSEKYAGLLLTKELESISKLLKDVSHPYIAILGGAKVKDKIGVINALLSKADKILIGGAMMFTFLKAKGYNVGISKCEDEEVIEIAKDFLQKSNNKIVLPVDVVCNTHFEDEKGYEKNIDDISNTDMGLDIGTKTVGIYKNILIDAKTVVWNGPMGVFEMENYCNGTKRICEIVSNSTKNGAVTIVGGGETVTAVEKISNNLSFSHISTGGGAFLEMLEEKSLPGIEILNF